MQWLEYGCVPSFELTWESASKLQDSNVTSLYSSGHSQWKDTIISFWQQWEEGPGATAATRYAGTPYCQTVWSASNMRTRRRYISTEPQSLSP